MTDEWSERRPERTGHDRFSLPRQWDEATASDGSQDEPGPGPEEAPGEETPREHRHRGQRRSTRARLIELPVLVVVAAVLALVVKTFMIQVFSVPTGSMVPTIDPGDKVLVNKLVYDFRSIQPGDIVVFPTAGLWFPQPKPPSSPLTWLKNEAIALFSEPPGPPFYIKRVIGTPGDVVACCNSHGQLTINGAALSESSFLAPGIPPGSFTSPDGQKYQDYRFSVKVPAGDLWVMGDDRDNSEDSRYYRAKGVPLGGFVPEDRVVGRAFLIIAPFSRWSVLGIPPTFLQARVLKPASAALAAANPTADGALVPVAAGLTAMTVPATRALPLVLGFTGALPVTWLTGRIRRRRGRRVANRRDR